MANVFLFSVLNLQILPYLPWNKSSLWNCATSDHLVSCFSPCKLCFRRISLFLFLEYSLPSLAFCLDLEYTSLPHPLRENVTFSVMPSVVFITFITLLSTLNILPSPSHLTFIIYFFQLGCKLQEGKEQALQSWLILVSMATNTMPGVLL